MSNEVNGSRHAACMALLTKVRALADTHRDDLARAVELMESGTAWTGGSADDYTHELKGQQQQLKSALTNIIDAVEAEARRTQQQGQGGG